MKILRIYFFLFSLLLSSVAFGGTYIDIRIFTGYKITSFNFTPVSGKYSVFNADKLVVEVLRDDIITFKIKNDTILVSRWTITELRT